MTQDKSLHSSPSEAVKARKKFLLSQQKRTTDAGELEMIRKQIKEVEYLLTRYSDPTTRRKIQGESDTVLNEIPIQIPEARRNNILLHLQNSVGNLDELYETEKQLEKVQSLLNKYIEPGIRRIRKE